MKKNLDTNSRFRGKIVAFRMSQEESNELDVRVAFSGMNKQDYLISKVLDREIVINPNIRLLKVLENEIKQLNQLLLLNNTYLEEQQILKLELVIEFLTSLSVND